MKGQQNEGANLVICKSWLSLHSLLGKYPVLASWLFLPVLQGKGWGTGPPEGMCQAWASRKAFPQLRDTAGYSHLP